MATQSPEDTTRMFDMLMGKGNPRNAAPGSKKGNLAELDI